MSRLLVCGQSRPARLCENADPAKCAQEGSSGYAFLDLRNVWGVVNAPPIFLYLNVIGWMDVCPINKDAGNSPGKIKTE